MSGTVARSLGALGDAIGGTANVNFDSSTLFIDGVNNNIGVGTSSPVPYGGGGRVIQIDGGSNTSELRLTNNTTGTSATNGGLLQMAGNDLYIWNVENSFISIGTNNAERGRFDASGNFFIGMTSVTGNGCAFERAAAGGRLYVGRTNNDTVAEWQFSGTRVGSISVTASATSYNTSSDYRLKENITAIANAGERLLNLKPCRFNFINDPTRTVDGFLAHEAAEVVPEAVTGEKDAVNEDGSIKAQGIDQSKLVPLLAAALQEALLSINDLKAEVQTMKTKIAALESN